VLTVLVVAGVLPGSAPGATRPKAPPIAGVTIDGERVSLAQFRGRPVLINVWSSWWSTCNGEAVAYARWVGKQGRSLAFLGLNAADTHAGARAFVERYGWTWPSIRDPQRALARRFGATYQPAFMLIDARGRFVAGFEGAGAPERWNALKARLP
jgi:cytochrome c biogenesis protein CcmG/thiol:disulfide interchange protein DsbE